MFACNIGMEQDCWPNYLYGYRARQYFSHSVMDKRRRILYMTFNQIKSNLNDLITLSFTYQQIQIVSFVIAFISLQLMQILWFFDPNGYHIYSLLVLTIRYLITWWYQIENICKVFINIWKILSCRHPLLAHCHRKLYLPLKYCCDNALYCRKCLS